MDFRSIEHSNTVFASDVDFLTPRRIRFASDIPLVGPFGFDRNPTRIRLRGVVDAAAESFVRANGAYPDGNHWYVDRRDPFPFSLDEHLPRMARLSIVPEIVDMVPSASWYASLANMMVKDAWDGVVQMVWRREQVCYECGSIRMFPKVPAQSTDNPSYKRLDGHEVWSFNGREETGETVLSGGRMVAVPGVQRLVAIRMLCGRCHETKHLGNARRRGHFERAFERLGAINRIDWSPRGEATPYREEIERKYATRNRGRAFWALDFAALGGIDLQFKASVRHIGGGVIVQTGKGGEERVKVRVINADMRQVRDHLVIRPHGWV